MCGKIVPDMCEKNVSEGFGSDVLFSWLTLVICPVSVLSGREKANSPFRMKKNKIKVFI
jgi:hypothetical protein